MGKANPKCLPKQKKPGHFIASEFTTILHALHGGIFFLQKRAFP